MKNLDFLVKRAKFYDVVADYINENTLKVYSPKYLFDSWLIIETESNIELWHQSKKNNLKKCSYHLHASIKKKYSIRALQKIKSHNEYVAFHKKVNKINLVDRVLGKVMC